MREIDWAHMPRWADQLHEMFDAQETLMKRFAAIEQLPAPPLALQAASNQRILKDFAWRVTEELTEACHEWAHVGSEPGMLEELADVWHFYVELCIFAGVDSQQCLIATEDDRVATAEVWRVVMRLGRAMHQLRNRSWKRKIHAVDDARFRRDVALVHEALVHLCDSLFVDGDQMHEAFFNKHQKLIARLNEGY